MIATMRTHRSGGFGSDGRFRTKRQYIAADGLPAVKEFRARKGETQRSVLLRADTWVAEQKGKVPCPSIKIEAALEVFIEHRQEQGKADKTIKVYRFASKIIGKHLGGLRIDQVGIYAVEKMLKKWQDKPRTAKMLREFGRNAYNWFERNGWVERNPFRDAEPVTYAADQWEEPISAAHFDINYGIGDMPVGVYEKVMGIMRGWINYDEERPPCVGVEVWAWVVGYGPQASMLEPTCIVDVKVTPHAKVCRTYRSLGDGIRINCGGAERVTHWMPYVVPGPPEATEDRGGWA